MRNQQTFTDEEYSKRKRSSRRESFLTSMDRLVPWQALIALIEPYYPASGRRGRQPIGIEAMLRMYFLQIWFNMADEALEESIYDSYAMRQFMKIDFYREDVPDATTLLKFRHLLERFNLQQTIFKTVNGMLEAEGKIMRGGTIVDATILEAPVSTKNSMKSRDPEMKQARKGNQWHFGMKAHIGVDAGSGMVHTVEVTSANVSDIEVTHKLIREDDDVVSGDAGYVGIEKRDEIKNDEHLSKVEYRINKRKGSDKKRDDQILKEAMNHLDYVAQPNWDKHIEYLKSKVRCKVEHMFSIVKRLFGYRRVAYRGLQKNWARLYMLFCSANLLRVLWSKA
jgi:IS5 family transposase